jgi:hypothetical protein
VLAFAAVLTAVCLLVAVGHLAAAARARRLAVLRAVEAGASVRPGAGHL